MAGVRDQKTTTAGKAERESTAVRLVALLSILASNPAGLSYAKMQAQLKEAGFDVCKRTIQRDIDALLRCFDLQKIKRGATVLWKLEGQSTQSLPFPVEDMELVAITMASRALVQTDLHWLSPYLRQLVAKLRPRFSRQYEKLLSVMEETGRATSNGLSYFRYDDLMEAIAKRRKVLIDYVDNKGTLSKHRKVAPLTIFHSQGKTYLAAFCYTRNGRRSFRLSRIRNLTVLHEEYPESLLDGVEQALGASIGAFYAEPEKVVLEVDELLARYLEDNPLHRSQMIRKEKGRYFVELLVGLNETLFHKLLGFGAHVRVLEPRKLAVLLTERHDDASAFQKEALATDAIQPELPLMFPA